MPRVPWPPPAHQQSEPFPRGFGIFSPYPGGDPGLYSPSAKLPPAFIPTPKVTEPLFAITGNGHIAGVPLSPMTSSRLQHLDLMAKSAYTPPRSVKDEATDMDRLNACTPIPPVAMTHLTEAPALASPINVIDLSTSDPSKKTVKVEANALKKKRTLPPPGMGQGGCSRTTPLTLRPQEVFVKKEPESLLSPVDTSSVFLSPISDTSVKVETVDIKTKNSQCLSPDVSGGTLSMGLAVSRRFQQHDDLSPSLLSSQEQTPLLGMTYSGGGLCDDRSSNLISSWPAPAHNPTLWQYSAPMDQLNYPYQIIREPVTGQLLLIPPPTGVEAIFWPSYGTPPPQMILPSPNSQRILIDSSIPSSQHHVPTSVDFLTPVIKVEATDCPRTPVAAEPFYSPVNKSKEEEYEKVEIATPPIKVDDQELPPPVLSSPPPSISTNTPPPSLPPPVDLTGLELLSNSIEKHVVVEKKSAPPLRRLDVLCALAEQLREDDSPTETSLISTEEPPAQLMDTPPCSPESQDGELPPPVLEKVTDIAIEEEQEISRPPKLTPHLILDTEGYTDTNSEWTQAVETRKRASSEELSNLSVKKRKVGRPKKNLLSTEITLQAKSKESSKLRKVRHNKTVKLEKEVVPQTAKDLNVTSHLADSHLPLRVLKAKGPVFEAGQLSAIQAPDVYGVTMDGDRNRHSKIYSREEVVKKTILEVKPKSVDEVPEGSRVCAYWSVYSRDLYPGTVTMATKKEQENEDFVSIKFDDGDRKRIGIKAVRLLPLGHPVHISEDKDSSLLKRKRRSSGSIEQLPSMQPVVKIAKLEEEEEEGSSSRLSKEHLLEDDTTSSRLSERHLVEDDTTTQEEEVEEESVEVRRDPEQVRRHLKKKRREKLKRLHSADGTAHSKQERRRHRHGRHHKKHKKHKHRRKERNPSTESRSQMAKLLPAKRLWSWADKGFARPKTKGRGKKVFHRGIQRGRETIQVGDCAVFLSTGRPDRPYIGRIESMWQSGNLAQVRVSWFYHPEETIGCSAELRYPGALFESTHKDLNDVQTISHRCEVLPLQDFTDRLKAEPTRAANIYDNKDLFYLAGYYDPSCSSLKILPGVEGQPDC